MDCLYKLVVKQGDASLVVHTQYQFRTCEINM